MIKWWQFYRFFQKMEEEGILYNSFILILKPNTVGERKAIDQHVNSYARR